MKKRILALLLTLSLIPAVFGCAENKPETPEAAEAGTGVSEKTDIDEADMKRITDEISNVISGYYRAKDVSGSFDAGDALEEDIAIYLTEKARSKRYVDDLRVPDKENYNVEVISHDYITDSSNIITFEMQALTTFNYAGRDFETTVSDAVYVKYDAENQKITDVLIPFDYYDEFVRPEDCAASKSFDGRGSEKNRFELTEDVASRQKELRENYGVPERG